MSDRRAGKRGLPKDDRAYEYEDGEDHEEVAKRPRPRSSDTSGKDAARNSSDSDSDSDNNTIDLFSNGLITMAVCSFLDVKELLHLTMCSKFVGEQIKHEHVVVSALMHGGHAKTSMERLVGLLRNNEQQPQQQHRKIYVPSPLRLLRLVNGKRCERCNGAGLKMVSCDFGVFFCSECNMLYTKRVARNTGWIPFLEHPRVAAARYISNCYIFTHTYHDTAGEVSGPLVTMSNMESVMRGQTTTEEIVRQCDEADGNAKYVDEIVKAFDQTKNAAENRGLEKYFKKKDATKNALEKKREKIHTIVEKLKSLLGEVPWKEALLDYEAVTVPSSSSKFSMVRFSNLIVNGLLMDIVKTPSRATKSKLQKLSESLLEKFAVVGETQYHDFSFLSHSDPLESTLLEYYSEIFPNSEHLDFLMESHLDLLREGKCLEVLETMDQANGVQMRAHSGGGSSSGVPHQQSLHQMQQVGGGSGVVSSSSSSSSSAPRGMYTSQQQHLLAEREPIKKESQKFLIFTRVLMKYLEQKDPALHVQVKPIIKDCAEKKRQKVKGYESVTTSMRIQLKKVVSENYWKRAEVYLEHFLKEKAKAGSQSAQHLAAFLSFDQIIARTIASSLAYQDESGKKKAEGLAGDLWKKERRSNANIHSCFQICTAKFPALHQQVVDFLSSPEWAAWKESPDYACYRQLLFSLPEDKIWSPSDTMFDLLSNRNYKGVVDALSENAKELM